jgi:hypothetical protein
MKLPKSKDYIKNIIETIQLDPYTTIEIDGFYDTTHKGNRYSCTVNHKQGTAICGGYGTNNQITLPTYESAILEALKLARANKQTIREFKLKLLLK